MTFEIILNNKDILYKITYYLSFENKILFGKCCKINFLKYYNFNSKDYQFKELDNIFEIDDDYIVEYIDNLKENIIDYELVFNTYIECNKRTYIENNLKHFYSIDTDADTDTETDDTDTDDTDKFVDKICNLPNDKFLQKIEFRSYYGRLLSRFSNIFEEEFDDILQRSIYSIYIRILFGHDNISKTCIFYDKKFEKNETKKLLNI